MFLSCDNKMEEVSDKRLNLEISYMDWIQKRFAELHASYFVNLKDIPTQHVI